MGAKRDLDGAIEEFRQSLQINPDYTIVRYFLGLACYKRGDLEDAIRTLRTYICLSDDEQRKEIARKIIREEEETTASSAEDAFVLKPVPPNKIIREVEGTTASSSAKFQSCFICGRECIQGPMLSDGSVYHQQCYDKESQCREHLDRQTHSNQQEILRLSRQVEEEQSFFVRLRRLFSDSESEVPNLRKRIAELEQETHRLSQERTRHLLTLERLHEYWLTYPPDWDSRCKQVRERFPYCQGKGPHSGFLHVHHKIPISKGGNHRLENLTVLCEHCHSEEHGGITFRYEGIDRPSASAQKLALLRQAISNNQIVHFSYTKRDGSESVRSIRPVKIETVSNSLCVSGYCYLRQEDRIFAIKRMRGVEIVDEPSRCYDNTS